MPDDTTRRRFLASIATTTAAAGIAGCLGGGGASGDTDEPSDETTPTDAMAGMTDTDSMGGMTETEAMGGMTDTDSMDGMTDTDSMDGMTDTDGGTTSSRRFEVTVTNVSQPGTITTSEGQELVVPLSPVAWAVHPGAVTAFTAGESASAGLESLAEDGSPSSFVSELSGVDGVRAGAATTPEGAESPGPLTPGQRYAFEVEAGPDHRLTLASMFVQSNDLFYAPEPAGVSLFADGEPITGEVTDRLALWDAGTEQNQEPGVGPDQAPRQSGPDTGPDEDATVRRVGDVEDGYDYPPVSDVVEVRVSPM